ncbi:unnamed protein product [Sympodiomycopsis kandeliae]
MQQLRTGKKSSTRFGPRNTDGRPLRTASSSKTFSSDTGHHTALLLNPILVPSGNTNPTPINFTTPIDDSHSTTALTGSISLSRLEPRRTSSPTDAIRVRCPPLALPSNLAGVPSPTTPRCSQGHRSYHNLAIIAIDRRKQHVGRIQFDGDAILFYSRTHRAHTAAEPQDLVICPGDEGDCFPPLYQQE